MIFEFECMSRGGWAARGISLIVVFIMRIPWDYRLKHFSDRLLSMSYCRIACPPSLLSIVCTRNDLPSKFFPIVHCYCRQAVRR